MITCVDSIKDINTKIKYINKDDEYVIDVDSNTNNIFYLEFNNNQTLKINPFVLSSSKFKSHVKISVIEKNTLDVVANINFNNNTIITFNLPTGKYYICFRVIYGHYNISVSFDYTSNNKTSMIDSEIIVGEDVTFSLKTKRQEYECTQQLTFELYESTLPNGLILEPNGHLHGILPIIDNENIKDFPSYNLYDNNFNGDVIPTETKWNFKVKLYIDSNADVFVVREFCIAIVNDWSLTHPLFDLIEVSADETEVIYDIKKEKFLLCKPCVYKKDYTHDYYIYDTNYDVVKHNTRAQFSISDGLISDGAYTSKISNIINTSDDLRYVISDYTSNNMKDNHTIVMPSQNIYKSEYIQIDSGVDNVYEWVIENVDLLCKSYDEDIVNHYIQNPLCGSVVDVNGKSHLAITYTLEDDITIENEKNRLIILKNEPMVCFLYDSVEIFAELTYESYN